MTTDKHDAWVVAARELEAETGAKRVHLARGTNPDATVAQRESEMIEQKEPRDTMPKRRDEEQANILRARELGRAVTFISECDGCQVTVTPSGNIFYNMADWY